MQRRWAALGLALIMALALTSCGTDAGRDHVETGRLSSRGTSRERTPVERRLGADGTYYANSDGQVTDYREQGESEWEKLGRELRESWDKLMNGAENTAQAAEQGVRDAAQKAEHGM